MLEEMKKVIHMKKIIIVIFLLLLLQASSETYAIGPIPQEFIQATEPTKEIPKESAFDIEAIYNKQIPLDIKFENNLDPYEQQDNYSCAMSPYPLVRTVMPMYSLKTIIEPGYYLLTPRKIGARDYLLFKERGRVLYTAPIFESKQIDPEKEYPQPKDPYDDAPFGLKSVFKGLGIISGRRTHAPQVPMHKVDCFQYNDQFYGINVYYKDRIYKTVYKTKLYE